MQDPVLMLWLIRYTSHFDKNLDVSYLSVFLQELYRRFIVHESLETVLIQKSNGYCRSLVHECIILQAFVSMLKCYFLVKEICQTKGRKGEKTEY